MCSKRLLRVFMTCVRSFFGIDIDVLIYYQIELPT